MTAGLTGAGAVGKEVVASAERGGGKHEVGRGIGAAVTRERDARCVARVLSARIRGERLATFPPPVGRVEAPRVVACTWG